MMTAERRSRILALTKEHNYLTLYEICRQLHFSESTIRRDLKALEHEGCIRLTRGGCIYNDHPNLETPQALRRAANLHVKRPIARRAAQFVQDNQIIMLDCSTTAMEMIPFLRQRRNLTIITNCQSTAALVAQQLECTLLSTGGKYNAPSASFVGFAAESALRNWFADIAFFSVHSIDSMHGPTDQGDEIARIKSVMFEQSQSAIMLADSTKFGRTSNYRLGPIANLSHIITNADPRFDDPAWSEYRKIMIYAE